MPEYDDSAWYTDDFDSDIGSRSEHEHNVPDGSYVNESAGTVVTISTERNTEAEWASITDFDTTNDANDDAINDDAGGNTSYSDFDFLIRYLLFGAH